jgi:hypothetical protein
MNAIRFAICMHMMQAGQPQSLTYPCVVNNS